MRRWRNGKARLPSKRTVGVRLPGGALTLRWRKRSDSPGPQPGACGFESRAEHSRPTVYGLGSGVSPPNRVRLPVGSLRGWRSSVARQARNPRSEVRIRHPRHSGVVQRQDASLLRKLSGFESLRRSHGVLAQLVRAHRDDNPERHVRLVLWVPRSCGEKDITLDYESRDWGFKSLRERAGLASSMGEHLVHTQGTEVRFLR